ncbi:MAG: cysteine hydrolase family protein [Methanomicrobium sp.]|nr:cysteine hydrolase family protein [Methanomicrobium sp.]
MVLTLLLVDIQNDYFPGGKKELYNIEKAAKNSEKILMYFRENNLPVIHVKHISTRKGASFFLPDSYGSEINIIVNPLSSEKVVVKNSPNSFLNTDLLEILRQKNTSELVICGAMSNMCIDASARAASDAGFVCTVISDACAAGSLEFEGIKIPAEIVHAAFMAALSGIYAKVKDTDCFLEGRKSIS